MDPIFVYFIQLLSLTNLLEIDKYLSYSGIDFKREKKMKIFIRVSHFYCFERSIEDA